MKKILLLLTIYSQLLTAPLLHDAIKQNNMPLLEDLLRSGENPNKVKRTGDKNIYTDFWKLGDIMPTPHIDNPRPLHTAILNDNKKAVEILFKYHANPNTTLKSYLDPTNGIYQELLTPLMLAIILNKIEMVELLLKHGANTEALTHNNLTALHKALIFNNHQAIELLLQYRANIWAKSVDGKSAYDMFRYQDIFYLLGFLD